MGVGVRWTAQQLNVFAFAVQQLHELLCTQLCPLIVVRHNLRHRNTGFVDFTIDQEGRDACRFGLLQRTDGGICPGVVQNDRFRFTGDGGLNQLVLFVHVVVMRGDKRGVTQLFCLRCRAVGFCLEERVVV